MQVSGLPLESQSSTASPGSLPERLSLSPPRLLNTNSEKVPSDPSVQSFEGCCSAYPASEPFTQPPCHSAWVSTW